MFGMGLSNVRRTMAHRKPVLWQRTRVQWADHARWNVSRFIANAHLEQDWAEVASGSTLPLDGELGVPFV